MVGEDVVVEAEGRRRLVWGEMRKTIGLKLCVDNPPIHVLVKIGQV